MQPIVTTPVPAAASVSARLRLDAIDFVRGIVMILMILDHTRDFAHRGGLFTDPLDPATTTPLLYVTRWLTHLCAPTFVLLAGLGVGLKRIRGATSGTLAWFLFSRGAWLVVMELTLIRLLVWFNLDPTFAFLQVIWAIGVSMVLLSAVVRLPIVVIGALAAAILLGHNLLDPINVPFWFPLSPAPPPALGNIPWIALHDGGFFKLGPVVVFARYPLLPWTGLLAAGYVLAEIYRWEPARRRRFLFGASAAMAVLFLLLRTFNVYGNPSDWAPQPTVIQSAMAFMNVEKYPPSLLYVLVTLLPALTLMAVLDGRTLAGGLKGAVVTFGRVPFFFYALQWITAHLSGIVITAMVGGPLAPYFEHLLLLVSRRPLPDIGGPLWAVYLAWFVSLLLIYPLCRWFAGVKARRRDWWLSYV
jgi:uncharacterized membrane protein